MRLALLLFYAHDYGQTPVLEHTFNDVPACRVPSGIRFTLEWYGIHLSRAFVEDGRSWFGSILVATSSVKWVVNLEEAR